MNRRNTKGYIGLFLGLASIAAIIVAVFVPFTKLTGFGIDGKITFFGTINVALCWIGVVLAIAAIVFGAMSKKDADKKGPRKSGVIIGIICIVLGLIASLVVGLLSMFTEFINSEGTDGVIANIIRDDPNTKKQVDDVIKGIQEMAGVKKNGILSSESTPQASDNTESEVSDSASGSSTVSEDA